MESKTVLITGGSSGIGRATALGLMRLKANVIVTSRSAERANAAAIKLNEDAGDEAGSARGLAVDTGDLSSVRALAAAVIASSDSLDVLINNAGALSDKYQTNDDGTEVTLASHLVGPYLLSKLLKDHLADAGGGAGGKILWMASGGMYTQNLDVDKIELSSKEYKGAVAYAKAKRGQVELANILGRRWASEVSVYSMHPGWVDTPGVDAALPGFGKVMGPTLRNAAEGADTMVWLAAAETIDAKPGNFFHDRQPRRTSYLPGRGATQADRQELLNWLDAKIADSDPDDNTDPDTNSDPETNSDPDSNTGIGDE